jgi:hypothetical protein
MHGEVVQPLVTTLECLAPDTYIFTVKCCFDAVVQGSDVAEQLRLRCARSYWQGH